MAWPANRSANSPRVGGRSRREFLKTGAKSLGSVALPALLPWASLGSASAVVAASLGCVAGGKKSVVLISLPGGPSHLETYDLKPNAPAEIRGEFRPINTNVSGIRVCEHLPLHAKIADKFAIVQGVAMVDAHDPAILAAPGRAAGGRLEVLVARTASDGFLRTEIVQQRKLDLPHGDWDTHGRVLGRELSIFQELRAKLPAYDRLLHDLITDTYARGLQQDVLIVARGEFGRTPWLNQYAGRNHWAPAGSVLFAGGGLQMGQVIGNTGPRGEREQIRSQPYTSQSIQAMVFRHLGFELPEVAKQAQIAELI